MAYQYGAVDAFNDLSNPNIETSYLDGLSLTHGALGSRQHVWSFVMSAGESTGGNHRPVDVQLQHSKLAILHT